MKKKKIFIVFAIMVFAALVIYRVYNKWPTQKWKEYKSLVKLWPQLRKEKIKSINFCYAPYSEIMKVEDESFFKEMFGFRVRDENDVKSWDVIFEVPNENLQECVNLIDKAMKNAKPNWPIVGQVRPMIWLERMLIITNNRKYIVCHVKAHISNLDKSRVFGDEWSSNELGEYLKKCGFPIPDPNNNI